MLVPDWLVLAIAVTTLSGNTLALVIGMNRFKTWLQKAVVEPYIKPIRDTQDFMRSEMTATQSMLQEHDRYIMMLLGKQLGGATDPKQVVVDLAGMGGHG